MKTDFLSKALPFLDSWLGYRHRISDIPGLMVAIGKDGKVVFNKAYGYANLESQEKLTTKHVYRVASHSKTFTATAIMQLVERGLLHVDDCVVEHLPWLKKHRDKRINGITVSQLLSHSAGLIRDGIEADYWQLGRSFFDEKELKAAILEADLVFDTNVQMKYSNLGFGLLGLLINSVSGVPYNRFVKENIVEVLRLSDTEPEITPRLESRMVTGYSRPDLDKKRLPIANLNTGALASATGFCSSGKDLVTYFSAQFVGSRLLLDDQLKKELQRTQWRITNGRFNEEYGLGFGIDYAGKRRVFGHGGGFPGQRTKTLCDPKEKLVVTVMVNAMEVDVSEIAKGIYSVLDYFEKNGSSSESRRDLCKFEGRFINLCAINEIVATGNKLVSINPGLWQPFTCVEELEYVDSSTLKVVKAEGYDAEGELIHFNFGANGIVKSIRYCGLLQWPEAVYQSMLKQNAQIENGWFKTSKKR